MASYSPHLLNAVPICLIFYYLFFFTLGLIWGGWGGLHFSRDSGILRCWISPPPHASHHMGARWINFLSCVQLDTSLLRCCWSRNPLLFLVPRNTFISATEPKLLFFSAASPLFSLSLSFPPLMKMVRTLFSPCYRDEVSLSVLMLWFFSFLSLLRHSR